MSPSITPFLEGFLLNAALVMGFGPQNTFLLRQSLARRHLFIMVALSVFLDAALMLLGTLGLGDWMRGLGFITKLLGYAGVIFLLYYGLRSLHTAFKASSITAAKVLQGRQNIILTLLAVSLLNPSVYLDTLLLIGGSANHYGSEGRFIFVTGAVVASLLWFMSLSYGAASFAPWLNRKMSLRLLDFVTGGILCFMAYRVWQQL
jgi:L-lysine exporter family protein LysE/ArgO